MSHIPKTALALVRKHFPDVEKVVDAKEGISLNVIKRDSSKGRKKDPRTCALAMACVRQVKECTGAIINIGTSYIVKGDTAIRYTTSQSVAREITSFDRHQDFAEGNDYRLSAPSPTNRLGYRKRPKDDRNHRSNGKGPKPVAVHKHQTADIRVSSLKK